VVDSVVASTSESANRFRPYATMTTTAVTQIGAACSRYLGSAAETPPSQLLVSLLGLGIAYVAYVGYRRHDRRPMLYFCLGFGFLFGPPAVVGVLVVVVGAGSEVGASVVTQFSKLVGLALVLAALRVDR
jgi:hypothetical protein